MRAGRIAELQRQRRRDRRWQAFDRWAPWYVGAVMVVDCLYLSHRLGLI